MRSDLSSKEGRLDGPLVPPVVPLTKVVPPTASSKSMELVSWMRGLSLESAFQLAGRTIASFPQAFLIAGVIICGFSIGMTNLRLKDNVRDGYTPRTSRSRVETDYYREFLSSEGDPVMTTVLMLARDGGSMHRVDYLREAVEQLNHLSYVVSANVGKEIVTYRNFCGHYCQSNVVVSYFYTALVDKMKTGAKNLKLTYPIAEMNGMKIHLERNFYGVKTRPNDTVTNIEYVQLIAISFLAEVKSAAYLEKVSKWEMQVYDYCTKYSAKEGNTVEMLVIGAEIVDTEMNKDGQRMAPYFATGFCVMFVFVCVTVAASSSYFGRLNWKTIIVAVCCAVVPILAITTTLGLSTFMGNRTNSLMLIMPFLIMGIGVNDSFLTVHAWLRQPLRSSEVDRMGRVLQEVGPSITTTTLTNVVTFLIGWLTPTEEISIFCLGSALALGFAYIYTLILFCPILYYCAPEPTTTVTKDDLECDKNECRRGTRRFFAHFVDHYCRLISKRWFATLLLVGAVVYWYFGLMGTLSISAKLDTGKILPKESPVRRPNRFVENVVWKEYYPVTVVVNSPVDIAKKAELDYLRQFVSEFEALPSCRGREFTIFWLRDYEDYFNNVAVDTFDYDAEQITTDDRPFGFSKLSGFLGSPIYSHNQAFMNLNMNKSVPIQKFSLMVVYENNTSWDDRIDLMLKWRAVVDRYPSLNATVWNVNSMFVDQMLSLKRLTMQTCLWTLLCMAIVCTIFIQNPISVVMATLSIASISLGVMGYLSFWDLDLDPVSLCAILISIGMAVDFVAHTTYHYQLGEKHSYRNGREVTIALETPVDRLKNTITNIAWPMSQAGVSTVICILPLVMLQNYIPLVFVKTITLVVIWGLFHGLVFLPAMLAQIPLSWLSYSCLRELSSSRSDEHELTPLSAEPEETIRL